MTRPRLLHIVRDADLLEEAILGENRPQTRADCLSGGVNEERPCPYLTCRHHLYLDVTQKGMIRLNHPGIAPDELETLPATCALDLADNGGMTLDAVGEALGITRERARQIEEVVLMRIRKKSPDL